MNLNYLNWGRQKCWFKALIVAKQNHKYAHAKGKKKKKPEKEITPWMDRRRPHSLLSAPQ
jgi:hypothetical protein